MFAPVDVPFSIESAAKALPVRQWILTKNTDGSFTTSLYDHQAGTNHQAESFQFDRGDQVVVQLSSGPVKQASPIVTVSSNRLEEQLVQLKNQLAIETANYQVVATGEKPELRRRLEEEVRLARENLKLQKKLLERTRESYKDGLVALQDLDIAENAHNESALRVQVAEKALEEVRAGEKPETRDFSSSRIESLKREIAFLEQKKRQYVIAAPFDGLLRTETLEGIDRLLLEDTSATVIYIPVRLKDSAYLRAGQQLTVSWLVPPRSFQCQVLQVDNRVEFIDYDQVVGVKLLTREDNLLTGLPIRCRIECGKVRMAEFLRRSLGW